MLSEWDMSGLRLRRGRCTGTVIRCNTRNEELIMKNEADIEACNCRLLKLSNVHRSVLLRDSSESMHEA